MSSAGLANRAGVLPHALAALLAVAGVGAASAAPPAPAGSGGASARASAAGATHAAAAESVTTDSGEPAISWTWMRFEPKPGEPRGYVLFQRDCRVCHGGGPARPGTRALRAKYRGKLPALLEQRTDLTAQYVKVTVRHGVSVMPPFRKTELSDADLDAIAAYLTRKPGSR